MCVSGALEFVEAFKEISCEAGKIKYRLLRSELDGRDSYSIEIEQMTSSGEVKKAFAKDITCEKDYALKIFTDVVCGQVEANILSDVIYDMLP